MKKVLCLFILIAAVGLSLLSPPFRQALANEKPLIKNRVVALVYDDSGSMRYTVDSASGQRIAIDNWKYANYSLQSLAGLLAPEDRLYVTRMTQPSQMTEIPLAATKRQQAIQEIKEWSDAGITPFTSVITGINGLKEIAKKNPDSEFWLVVLTDGVFNELDPLEKNVMDPAEYMKQAHQQLLKYREDMKGNGATTRSVLVTVEQYLSDASKQTMKEIKSLWKDALDAEIIESNGQENIIEKINQAAALITNRDPESGPLLSLQPIFTDNQVQFSSLFPIKRLTLLEQVIQHSAGMTIPNNMGRLTINQTIDGFSIEGPYEIISPSDPYKRNPPIEGQITHYKEPSAEGAMREGEYRIELQDAAARKERIQFLVEPALDFQLSVHKQESDGTLHQRENEFFFGSPMLAQVKLVKSNGSNETIKLIPAARDKVIITATLDTQELEFTWDNRLQAFTASFELPDSELNKLKATVHIKGFFKKEQQLEFRGVPPRLFGMESGQVEWSSRVDQLEEALPLRFYPTVDGAQISEQELAEIFPSLRIDTGGKRIHFDVKHSGSDILLYPRNNWNQWFTDTGEIPIKLTINGKYLDERAEVQYIAFIKDIPWWMKYGPVLLAFLIAVILVWWLLGMIRKPRFKRHSSFMTVTIRNLINGRVKGGGYESTEAFRSKWWSRWLIPYKAETSLIHDITFKAGSKGDHILLPKEAQMPEMKVSDSPLSDSAGRRDIRIYSNDEIVVRSAHSEALYKFCKN
ncbi:hypothetical protein [Cohnella sp.]|uniref:hypothetical protein n=1 Tax=Cohnella sp. TaxID=1883426 RepID=UPI003562371D